MFFSEYRTCIHKMRKHNFVFITLTHSIPYYCVPGTAGSMQSKRYCISWAYIPNCLISIQQKRMLNIMQWQESHILEAEVESIFIFCSVISSQARRLTKLYNLTNGWTCSSKMFPAVLGSTIKSWACRDMESLTEKFPPDFSKSLVFLQPFTEASDKKETSHFNWNAENLH